MKQHHILYCILFFIASTFLHGQEGTEFSFDDEHETAALFKTEIGGTIATAAAFLLHPPQHTDALSLVPLLQADLHLAAEAPLARAYFGIRLNSKTLEAYPVWEKPPYSFEQHRHVPRWIDEAYLNIILDTIVVSSGIQKLTWGRSETASVLDVINPLDKSDLMHGSWQESKIARPLFHVQFYTPLDVTCEAVFLPAFEGHRMALDGIWKPMQLHQLEQTLKQTGILPHHITLPNTHTLQYAQGGGRITGTFGLVHDIGVQYFYGRLQDASFSIDEQQRALSIDYNSYHHVGVDYGTALGPIGLQAECAANITEDLAGDNPAVYNPFLAWNTSIAYNAPFGFVCTAAASEHIKLNYSRIGTKPFDIEHGHQPTDTLLILALAQSLLRSSLEWKVSASVGVEDADFCIRPGVHWQYGSVLIDYQFAFFGGRRTGKQGQFYNNNSMSLSVGYTF
ncbi:MAG: hypothetical protein ACTTJ7_00350 [Treponema sp.]